MKAQSHKESNARRQAQTQNQAITEEKQQQDRPVKRSRDEYEEQSNNNKDNMIIISKSDNSTGISQPSSYPSSSPKTVSTELDYSCIHSSGWRVNDDNHYNSIFL